MTRKYKIVLSVWIAIMGCMSLRSPEGRKVIASENSGYPMADADLQDELSRDFLELQQFTSKIQTYNINKEDFYGLFNQGLYQSLGFYLDNDWGRVRAISSFSETSQEGPWNLQYPSPKSDEIEIDQQVAFRSLNQFAGEWHGVWESIAVHHNWLPVRESDLPISNGYTLTGYQSCFTGDGIGWNFVLRKKNKIIILGFVYHFDDQGNINARNPHVALVNTQLELTWISDSHIYHEWVGVDHKTEGQKRYVITGSAHEDIDELDELKKGFQAVYLSVNENLPDFETFEFKIKSGAKGYVSTVLGEAMRRLLRPWSLMR